MRAERNESRELQNIVTSLSPYEREVLSHFFRFLIEKESSGYTLYGEKPLSVQEFMTERTPIAIDERLYYRSCILKEGSKIWEQSGLTRLNSNYAIQVSKSPNPDGWCDIFFINKAEFVRVVDQHLSIFQYILGPKLTASALLEKALNSGQNLLSIFHENKVLTGLVLGYGLQNFLMGSRSEYLREFIAENQSSPNLPDLQDMRSPAPSFGFATTSDELQLIEQELVITATHTDELPQLPWFASVADEETHRLLRKYEGTQKILREVLTSQHFLEKVFLQFFGARVSFPSCEVSLEELLYEKLRSEERIPRLIGQALCANLLEENASSDEIEWFIQGFLDIAGERQDLGALLRTVDDHSSQEAKQQLLHRLGQKMGDRYRALGSLATLEDIARYIQGPNQSSTEAEQILLDQVNTFACLLNEKNHRGTF